jgi:hypothetical protein
MKYLHTGLAHLSLFIILVTQNYYSVSTGTFGTVDRCCIFYLLAFEEDDATITWLTKGMMTFFIQS